MIHNNNIAPVSSAGTVLLLFRTNANALSTGIYAILMRCQWYIRILIITVCTAVGSEK